MAQEIVKLSPDALGYKDRGKMKWMGMMLSDHAEALKKEKKNTQTALINPKEKLSAEEISTIFYKSYTLKKPVAVQLDIVKDGQYLPDIEGVIEGVQEEIIYLKRRNQSLTKLRIEDIRHVEWIKSIEWYAKYQRQTPPS